jgi:hypothetical protein
LILKKKSSGSKSKSTNINITVEIDNSEELKCGKFTTLVIEPTATIGDLLDKLIVYHDV